MPGCQFCLADNLLEGEVVVRGESCYVLSSNHPVLDQAAMMIPYRHAATPFDMTEAELREAMQLMQQVPALLAAAEPDGYTIGWNVGTVGGQEVMHVHLHVIARFADEPLAGQGLRYHLKHPHNRRQKD